MIRKGRIRPFLVFWVAILATLLPACDRSTVSRPPESACRELAANLEHAVREGDIARIHQLVDWHALVDTGLAGVPVHAADRAAYAEGALEATRGDFARRLVRDAAAGSFEFVELHTKGDSTSLSFRLDADGESKLYELYVARREGEVRVVDFFLGSRGTTLSEALRRDFTRQIADGFGDETSPRPARD